MASYYGEGNISVDQKIAEYEGANTRFPSMTVRVNESNLVSFTRTGVQVPDIDLRGMFRALFIEDLAEKKATAAEKLKRQNSILDVVLEKAKVVEKDLSKRDQLKFAEYLDAVRTLEKKIELLEKHVELQNQMIDALVVKLDSMGVVVKDIDDNTHRLDRMEGLLDELDNRL